MIGPFVHNIDPIFGNIGGFYLSVVVRPELYLWLFRPIFMAAQKQADPAAEYGSGLQFNYFYGGWSPSGRQAG